MVIAERFKHAVLLHLKRLSLRKSAYAGLSTPLILCIEGRPGIGKSTQVAAILRDLGCPLDKVDTSSFGGMYENDPVKLLSDRFEQLRLSFQEGGPRPCLIMDDFDLSLGKLSSTTSYTVNTQLTTGWLMALADEVQTESFDDSSPAIFVTGNDLSSIYSPLLRSGRARVFKYEPTHEEMLSSLRPIIDRLCPQKASCLMDIPRDETIAEILDSLSGCIDLHILRSNFKDEDEILIDEETLLTLGFRFEQ